MVEHDWFTPGPAGRYLPAERAVAAFERGFLHSVIDGNAGGIEVVDELTGASLGQVASGTTGDRVGLGGRKWQVVGKANASFECGPIRPWVCLQPSLRVVA